MRARLRKRLTDREGGEKGGRIVTRDGDKGSNGQHARSMSTIRAGKGMDGFLEGDEAIERY